MDTSKPEILKITGGISLADRKLYTATVRYPRERPMTVYFNGPTNGLGPIHVSWLGYSTQVIWPERFGARFDREWIEAFYR
jgi:hypothetical protein